MSGKKNKAVWLVAGMGVLFVLLTGILYVGAKTKGPVRLVYIPKVIDDKNDFWKFLLEGVQMAAEESGAEVTIMAGKNETDVQGQIGCHPFKPDQLYNCARGGAGDQRGRDSSGSGGFYTG